MNFLVPAWKQISGEKITMVQARMDFALFLQNREQTSMLNRSQLTAQNIIYSNNMDLNTDGVIENLLAHVILQSPTETAECGHWPNTEVKITLQGEI